MGGDAVSLSASLLALKTFTLRDDTIVAGRGLRCSAGMPDAQSCPVDLKSVLGPVVVVGGGGVCVCAFLNSNRE